MAPLSPLDTLLRENLPLIYQVVRDCNTPEDRVEDVVQDVLVSVHASFHTFDPSRGALSTWLGAVARNVARRRMREDYARAARFADEPVPEDEIVAEGAADSEEQLIQQEEAQFILDTLAQMPTELRVVVEQRDFRDVPWEEMASRSGVASSTLRSRREKAITLLMEAIRRRRAEESRRAGLFPLPFSIDDLLARARAHRDGALRAGSAASGEHLRRELVEHEAHLAGDASEFAWRITEKTRPGSREAHRGTPRSGTLHSVALLMLGGVLGGALVWFAMRRFPSPGPEHFPPTPTILTEARRSSPLFAPGPPAVTASATLPPLAPTGASHLNTAPACTATASAALPLQKHAIIGEAAAEPAGEAELIEEAQKAFEGGDPARARVLLERHEKHFPSGRLAYARVALQAQLPKP